MRPSIEVLAQLLHGPFIADGQLVEELSLYAFGFECSVEGLPALARPACLLSLVVVGQVRADDDEEFLPGCWLADAAHPQNEDRKMWEFGHNVPPRVV